MSRDTITVSMGVLILLIVVLFIASIVKSSKAYSRAKQGLRIIEQSDLRPISKILLLMEWNKPYASKEQLEWLVNTIEEIKAKEAKS